MHRHCIFFLFLFPFAIGAQEQLGMRLERYAGAYGASINPAQTALMPYQWEVTLFSAELFAENNYAFLRNTSVQNTLRNSENLVAITDLDPDRPPPANAIIQDFFNKDRKMRGILHTRVAGPGFLFRFGGNHVIGLQTAIRSDVTMYKIPAVLRYAKASQVKKGETVEITPTEITAMGWGEVGLHYSHKTENDGVSMAWGISPKLLIGMAGGFGKSNNTFSVTPSGGDTAIIGSPTWEYGLSGNILDQSFEKGSRVGGLGFATDMGISWFSPDGEDGDYRWKAGISLLDLGLVNFKRGAERHKIAFDSIKNVDGSNINASTAREYTRKISDALLGDPNRSLQSEGFSMGLPTAISIQVDYKMTEHCYIAAILTQRTPIFKHSVRRASTLAFIPRFEHRWFSVSLPVMINDWQSPRFGAAVRLGWLYLGSDNLGSFMQRDELSGTDFYVGLKINGFSLRFREREGSGLRPSKSRGHKQKRRQIKCYDF